MKLKFDNNHDFLTLFEEKLKKFTGAKYVILTDRCTNAIFLSLKYHQAHTNMSNHDGRLLIPNRTYLSVPQVLIHAGFKPVFSDKKWKGKYKIGDLPIYDCAVGFKKNMYKKGQFQCLSFQQKKALPIGKSGAILLDDKHAYNTLKRMVHDGRDGSIPVEKDENITFGYHMNMSPDEAVKGVLLLNQFNGHKVGSYKDYPNIEKFI